MIFEIELTWADGNGMTWWTAVEARKSDDARVKADEEVKAYNRSRKRGMLTMRVTGRIRRAIRNVSKG